MIKTLGKLLAQWKKRVKYNLMTTLHMCYFNRWQGDASAV